MIERRGTMRVFIPSRIFLIFSLSVVLVLIFIFLPHLWV
jgi:hypothetical protein